MTSSRLRSWPAGWPALAAWSLLVVAAVYGRAATLAFLADDFFQFPFADRHSLTALWRTAEGLQYFRPLAFTVWALLPDGAGPRDPAGYHLLNLALHWANGLQVAWLAGRLWPARLNYPFATPWPRRYLAATLFLLFPFGYQAVLWVAAMMHPLVTFLILLSLIAYWQYVCGGPRRWAALSLLVAFLAPFAHENGVLTPVLLLALELARPAPPPLRHRLGRAALWLLPVGLWWLIWRAVPADLVGVLTTGLNPAGVGRSLVYAAQTAAYPLTWAGAWLSRTLGLDQFAAAAGLSAVAFALAVFWQRRRPHRLWLLPWLWLAAGMAPAVLFIPFRWMSASPRTLMVASVGVALLWSEVIIRAAGWAAGGRRTMAAPAVVAPAVAGLLAVLLVGLSVRFIDKQMRLYILASSAIDQAVAATAAAAAVGDPAVIINFPSWLAPGREDYALGEEGVILLGNDSELDGLLQVYLGGNGALTGVRADAIREEVPYHVGLTGDAPNWNGTADPGAQVFVTRYAAGAIRLQPAGALPGPGTRLPPGPPLARFDGGLALLAATAEAATATAETAASETGAVLALTWQVTAPLPPDVTVFVHLVDAGGRLVGQADGDPLAGTYPLGQWPPGRTAVDRRVLPQDAAAAHILVGVYHRATGERLAAYTAAGVPWPDNAVPGDAVR